MSMDPIPQNQQRNPNTSSSLWASMTVRMLARPSVLVLINYISAAKENSPTATSGYQKSTQTTVYQEKPSGPSGCSTAISGYGLLQTSSYPFSLPTSSAPARKRGIPSSTGQSHVLMPCCSTGLTI